tara:strand:+ start:35 stop:460 length:426 start_codon:yes stop_codon:yes gene_type:complete
MQPPNYQKDAIPTPQGWRHPRTGELLVSRPLSQEQIDEYMGTPASAPQMLKESPTTMEEALEYEDMSKDQLEEVGREHGIELDKRHSKDDLIDELESHISENPDLTQMTKVELEAMGREHGIELDRRKSKADLIEELKEAL